MTEYHKIETLFERDINGTKKLIEGAFRNDAVKYLANNDWYFTEKIDGTNIRIHWDGHKIEFAGRTDRAQIPKSLMDYLTNTFDSMEAEEMFEQKFGETDVILFGEGYGPGIQKGGAYRNDVSFILFDVLIGDTWLKRDSVEDIATAFGVDIVPIIFVGNIKKAVDFVKTKPKSTIGTANMEGVVGRPVIEMKDRLGRRVIVKIKVCDFV